MAKKEVKELKNAFEGIIGTFNDKQGDKIADKLYCLYHKVYYKAIPTNNKCLKFYKNCPYCEAETNYRIALKKHIDIIAYNKYATHIGKDTQDITLPPEKPSWWLETKSSGYYPAKFNFDELKDLVEVEQKNEATLSQLIDEVTKNDEIDYPF